MKLQTNIPLAKQSENLIDYSANVLLLGSCFSENVGGRLEYYKFKNCINPFGILFHPLAIENLIEKAAGNHVYTDQVFRHNEQWSCFEAHSKLDGKTKEDVLINLNEACQLTRKQLEMASHIIITYGTSWVYKHKETESYVANCHKIPQKAFQKELLSIEAIETSIQRTINAINKVNSNVQIIFTVSPVRHLKDGFNENSHSKAHLISAVGNFLNQNSTIKNIRPTYFPSYEIMLDELRDYRFYKEDMVHPNKTAINYIFEKFAETWMHPNAFSTMKEVEYIQKAMNHKPFNPNSTSHQEFVDNLEKRIESLITQYQHITF